MTTQTMHIIDTSNINTARKEIEKLKKENSKQEIIIRAQDKEEINRKILENPQVDIFLSPEIHGRKKRLKQRDSGLNEILCKLATKNNIKIAIDIESLKKMQPQKKATTIARIIQNITLCKRTKTPMILYPIKKYSKQNIQSFLQTLKSSTSQAKEATLK